MKALITGSHGFVGQYLRKELQEQGFQVFGFDSRHGQNLLSYEAVRGTLDRVRPDYIFHLAAQAYVPESFANPKRTFEVNTIGSTNLLEAVRQLGLKTRILLAGTSEEYGGGDVSEYSMLEPRSPYAISKVAMDQMGQLYAKSYGMNIVVTRAFNHTGPGRGEQYAESSFAKQIVEIERGRQVTLEHGNLSGIRNYTDVRDVVKAYILAIKLPSSVYNICSDKNISMRDVLDMLIDLSTEPIPTQENKNLYRPSDFSFKEPECDKFTALTGWKPEILFRKTMINILEDWRERLA